MMVTKERATYETRATQTFQGTIEEYSPLLLGGGAFFIGYLIGAGRLGILRTVGSHLVKHAGEMLLLSMVESAKSRGLLDQLNRAKA